MRTRLKNIEEWLDRILRNNLLPDGFVKENVDASLDSRDSDPFDSEWVSADKSLEKALSENNEKQEIQAIQEKYRKLFFKSIMHEIGSADLAGYISDDFELIIGALACDLDSPFVYSLMTAYMQKTVPDNLMQRTNKNPLLALGGSGAIGGDDK